MNICASLTIPARLRPSSPNSSDVTTAWLDRGIDIVARLNIPAAIEVWRSPVSAPALGAGGRGFESLHLDTTKAPDSQRVRGFSVFYGCLDLRKKKYVKVDII